MKNSKDKAPYGWYVVSYLLRFIELGVEGNDDPEKRFHTWENTILAKAKGLDEAHGKAEVVF